MAGSAKVGKSERRAEVARKAQLLREGSKERADVAAPPPPPYAASTAPEGVLLRLGRETGEDAIRVAMPKAATTAILPPPPPMLPAAPRLVTEPEAIPSPDAAPEAVSKTVAVAGVAALASPDAAELTAPVKPSARLASSRPHLSRTRMPLVASSHAPRPVQRAVVRKPSRQASSRPMQAQGERVKATQRPRTSNRPLSRVGAKQARATSRRRG